MNNKSSQFNTLFLDNGISFDISETTQIVLEHLAIDQGVTLHEMLNHLLSTSKTVQEIDHSITEEEIETKNEFNERFRNSLQDTVKNHHFTDDEIAILKKAYYFSQMMDKATVPQPTPHDKNRYKKYKNAIDTIEEMLILSNSADKEMLLSPLQRTYNLLIKSKMDIKKDYKKKMDNELSKISISNYSRKNIIESFTKSI